MSSEEFFMYLTIGLIIVVPLSARVYRYFAARQIQRTLQEQFGSRPSEPKEGAEKRGSYR
jgi:hypothetical protein